MIGIFSKNNLYIHENDLGVHCLNTISSVRERVYCNIFSKIKHAVFSTEEKLRV